MVDRYVRNECFHIDVIVLYWIIPFPNGIDLTAPGVIIYLTGKNELIFI